MKKRPGRSLSGRNRNAILIGDLDTILGKDPFVDGFEIAGVGIFSHVRMMGECGVCIAVMERNGGEHTAALPDLSNIFC